MRLTKIYTKVGDKGTTLLASGEKVKKSNARINAYGTVDELNSHIGMLVDLMAVHDYDNSSAKQHLLHIQNELFDLGGELATPAQVLDVDKQQVVSEDSVSRLELEIDRFNEDLPPLKNFVLPGGHILVSQCHIARCVCRRAERCVVELSEESEVRDVTLKYINRLSDWLFVFGRHIASSLKVEETLWNQK